MNLYQKNLTPALTLGALLFFSACGQKGELGEGGLNEEVLSGSPEIALDSILDELAKHNGSVLWEAMPSSYQVDVNEVVRLTGEKVDGELYDQGFHLVDRVVAVFDKQQDFFFNTSLGTAPEAQKVAAFKEAWPSITHLVETLMASPIASVEGLKNFDGASFFSDTVSPLLKDLESLMKLDLDNEALPFSSYSGAVVALLEGSDEEATLKFSFPDGMEQTRVFSKVDSRWVPKDLAADWAANIVRAREQLASVDPEQISKQKPQILSVFAMIEGVLLQVESAETQEQFDQAIKGAMLPLMGLFMMGQGLGK